ncbi:MAG TPA: MBL fold metallo-hydrolase [Thermomicrobiales bacterium]|jgi:glyoxylase-like metal-dependent hydrolase (beta-lactamase superfamily II)
MTTLPEKIAPGIYRADALPLKYNISVYLIAERDGWTLVDTALESSVPRIKAALLALGGGPETLKRIYLTHHHSDHIGGLGALAAWAPSAEIIAPEGEAAIISGEKPPEQSENPLMRALTARQRLPTHPVARVVRAGDLVGGFRVIATPGHTLGHTSLLHEGHQLLLTADAFGQLITGIQVGVTKPFCSNPALAKQSAQSRPSPARRRQSEPACGGRTERVVTSGVGGPIG